MHTYAAVSGKVMLMKLVDNVSVYISMPAPRRYSSIHCGVVDDCTHT